MRKAALFALLLMLASGSWAAAARFESPHVLVIDDTSGDVLLHKDADRAVPIASLTKLMTAMVVLDARQDLDETLRIEAVDTDPDSRDRGCIRVGTIATRATLLELALLASDNRAMAALARHHPGGPAGFDADMQRKIAALELMQTRIEEPTGLSARNLSSARDMAAILQAAARYPAIARITSQRSQAVQLNGRSRLVHNTNGLVGTASWHVLLSKTGYTNDAGRCLGMRAAFGQRTVTIVLLGAAKRSQRSRDAQTILRWLGTEASSQRAASL
ncbi:MAG TPA: serine hydrolase [Burkholderiaceae bacterium]|nr:serine hydrolase [Burkholderiaceae bacterium]